MCQNNIFFFNTTNISALRVISLKMAKYVPLMEVNDIYIYIGKIYCFFQGMTIIGEYYDLNNVF